MRLFSTIIVSLRALRRNAMRSLLTALGIIIGVGAVIAVVSLGNGAKSQVEAQIASLGQNIITVFPGTSTSGGVRGGWGAQSTLTAEEAEQIRAEIAGTVNVSPEFRDRNQILANGLNWNTQILGEDASYTDIRSWPVKEGAMFTDLDVRGGAKVCVIGQTVANQLFPNDDPIGQTLKIRNIPVRVVGVLSTKGFNAWGQDQDDVVLVPYTTYLKRVARRPFLNSILVQADSKDNIERIQRDITDLLTQRRAGRDPDFIVRNQDEFAAAATESSRVMRLLLLSIAAISLAVGGIGIMNIMLVSVTERTREIGIRLAVGAHQRDIRTQFLIEAVTLSALGGSIGVLLGVGASDLLTRFMSWPTMISTLSVLGGLGFSALIGIIFGYFPAHKAAQLDPIDALRYE